MIWGIIQTLLSSLVKPVFDFLNKRVDADMQKHIVDTKAIADIAGTGIGALTKADELNAQTRQKEGKWGPTIIMMGLVLTPFVWHEWQVVLDSSRFLPLLTFDWAWGFIPYPNGFVEHRIGSWGVPGIGRAGPDGQSAWDKTEQAIFTSLFVGASAAVATVAAIKAIKK